MADYKGVLDDLQARRVVLDRERSELETAIVALTRLAGAAQPSSVDSSDQAVRPKMFARMTMPKAIATYFNGLTTREPQTTRQIMEALVAGGRKKTGSLRGHVYNTMHRLSQQESGLYRREPDGRWSLRAWAVRESQGSV